MSKLLENQKSQQELQEQIKQLLTQMQENRQNAAEAKGQQNQGQPKSGKGQKGQGRGQGQGQGGGQPGEGDGEGGEQDDQSFNPYEEKKGGQGQGQEEGDGEGEGPHVIDNHEIWKNNSGTVEQSKMAVQNALQSAVKETERKHGLGSIPSELRNMIDEELKQARVDWKQILRNYIGRKVTMITGATRNRPNRRLGLAAPGKTLKQGPKTLFAVDCSGSVGDAEYVEIMSEIKSALKNFPDKCDVCFFDYVMWPEVIKLGSAMKKLPRRPLSGGTSFQPVMDYAAETKPDLLIVLTDGEAPTPTPPKCAVLWVILGGRDNPNLFGKRVVIDPDDVKKIREVRSND